MTSPNQVVSRLAELSRELDQTVHQLDTADVDAVRKTHAAKLEEAKAFLKAEGSVDARKRLALIATADLLLEAELAEAVVRSLRQRIGSVRDRIDVGRSMSSAMKAEMAFATQGGTP